MNGQQQSYPEELQIVVDKMKANREPQFNIDIMVQSYYASKQDAGSGPEPTQVAGQQEVEENVGIPKESSIDQEWWDNAGLDRSSYFDEQGSMLPPPSVLTTVDPGWDQIRLEEENAIKAQAALESAESYDSTDISEGEGDSEYSTQSIVEDSVATEEQRKENIEKASADYQEFIDASFAYNSITDEDLEAETPTLEKYEAYQKRILSGQAKGQEMISYEEYTTQLYGEEYSNSLPSIITAKHNGYESNPTFRDAKINIAKSEYAKKAGLSESETKKLLKANINPANAESMEPFSTFDEDGNVVSFENEYKNINPNQSGRILSDGSKLGDKLRKGVEDKLTAQNDAESQRANVKKFVEALPSYSKTSATGAVVKAATGLDLGLFLKSDAQKLIEKRAKEDFKLLESNVQKIASEADVVGSQIKNNGALLTKAHEDLKALGDVRAEINELKNGEYTTEAQVKNANQKISALVNDYTAKFNAFDKYRKANSTLNNAAARIGAEMKDLDVKVKDLGAFTEFIGDNHQIGTQMAWSAANAAIDLGQGFMDFAYMVNPFGALSDELIDWAGEDSLTASIVEGVRIAAAPMTGGLSLYSGDRRDDMRDAIDNFQENVSSKIEQPPAFSSIKDVGSFAEWAAVTGIAQAPQLALMYATGGTSGLLLMGAGAAGTKYNEMEENRETYKESGGLYGIDHSFASMLAVSTFTGAVEALSEKVTLGQLNAAGRTLKNEVFKASGKRGIAKYLRNDVFTKDSFRSTLRGGKDLFEEGGSEFLATVGGNALTIASGDKSVGLWDGGLESFVTGAMISSTIKTPSLFRSAVAPFQSKTTSEILNNNLDVIERNRAVASGETGASADAVQFAQDIIAEAVHENKLALELDIKRVDAYEDADKSRLIDIESDNIDLRRKATAIVQDETLDESQKKEMISDLQTKLDNNIAEKQAIIEKYPEDVVNKKYSETSLGRQPASQTFEENIEFAKKHSALYGLEVNDTMSPAEIEAYLLEKGYSEEDAKDGRESDGFIVGNDIIINREVAIAKNAVTVGSHELLHGILRKAMDDKALSTQVISQLKKSIGSQWSVVQQRIDENYTPEYMAKNPDEYLTLVSDAIAAGEITYQETVFDKLRDALNEIPIFKKYFPNIKFKTGRDVYRFLREYNKSIHKGALATEIVKATQTDEDVKRTEAQVKKDGIKPSRTRIKRSTKVNTPYEVINKMAEGVKTKAEWKESQGFRDAVAAVEPGGIVSNMILSQKMSPGKTAETIKSVRNRLMNFDPASTRKTGSLEPITLAEFMMSNIKFGKLDASKALFMEGERAKMEGQDIDAKTSDGMAVIQVAAETNADVDAFENQDMSMQAQAKRTKLAEQGKSESDRYSGLRTELGLEKPMMDKVRQAVMKTFGTKLPDVNSKKFKAALQKAYRTELKKPIQDMIGKGAAYDTFLAENFPIVFKFLPKETLLQMERNVAPENRIFTKSERITKPTEVDKLISDGLLPKETNRLSGPTLITKLPYPGSKKVMAYFRGQNMGNALGYKVGASTLGTRKDKLAMEMGVELGFDATMETVQQPEVAERRESILELTGQVQAENDVSVMAKQIDRDPNIKFSNTSNKSPSDIFADQTMSLVKDVVNNGFETVFTEDGKLVEGYPGDFSKKAIDFAYNLWDGGTLHEGNSIGFKAKVALSKKFPQEIKDAFKEDGTLKNNGNIDVDGKGSLDRLFDAASALTTELGSDVMSTIGFEIAGFKNRIMNSPEKTIDKAETARQGKTVYAKDEDGNTISGQFFERLQKLSEKVRKSTGAPLPFGLVLKAISIMNKNAGVNSVFGKVQKILDMPIKAKGKGGKLEMLAKLQPEIDAANAANIKLAKHIATVLIKGVRDGSIDQVSALHLLQAQTGIVNGFRGLSGLGLITVLDGSQKPGENHPHYKKYLKELSKTMPKDKARIEAIKRTGYKGEHLAPNSNTMFKIAELFNEDLTGAELNNRLDDIFRGHSQMHTTIGLTKTMDKELGATNDTDFNRVKALDQVDIDATVRADGTPYPIVLAEVEILKEVSKMNSAVDQRNESTKVMDKAIKASKSGRGKIVKGIAETDIRTAVSGVNPDGYSNIRFSKSHRAEYEQRLIKNRAGLKGNVWNKRIAKGLVDDLFRWLDSPSFYLGAESPIYAAKHQSKFEKLALHYMVHHKLRLPEDGYKVIEAERLARVKKLDPFSFKNPNEIIERYSEEVDGKRPTNPDDVPAFTNKRELANGITIYDVNFAENFDGAVAAERQAVRDQVNHHFGKKSNPWCIVQSVDGKLTDSSKEYWAQYGDKKIIFKDGKLLAMQTESREDGFSDAGDVEFWSRDNVKYNEIPGNDYIDSQGRNVRGSFDVKTGKKLDAVYGATRGSIESGKIEVWGVYVPDGLSSVGDTFKEALSDLGVRKRKPALFLKSVERYNKDGELHGISEEHVDPNKRFGIPLASSMEYAKEYKNGEFIGAREDRGDGQGLGPMEYTTRARGEEGPNAIQFSKSAKGITVLDFDDTLATTKSNVLYTAPGGTTGKLNAEEFAKQGGDLLAQGFEFDFSEFNKVVDGKTAPLFNKALKLAGKFGTDNMFILTARSPDSAKAIKQFLDAQGLKIPLRNITGLGKSEASAKANWIAEKVGEGYNDFYFADDAIQNVKAVKDMLDQFDVKGKVQQARVDFLGDPRDVEFKKESSINDIKDTKRLTSPDVYSNIKFSKSHRSEYESTVSKNRPDLVRDGLVSKTVDSMFDFIDSLSVPVDKKRKYERATTKWLATSNIKLTEDQFKLTDAINLAERFKLDVLSYSNPNEIIEAYAGKVKQKPLDPNRVKEFSEGVVTNDNYNITEHVVEDTREGQLAVRNAIDSHWGKKSNPWCVTQTDNGKLTPESWEQWVNYGDKPKSIIFQDGKLLALKANNLYWDRMDNDTKFAVVSIKEGRTTKKVELRKKPRAIESVTVSQDGNVTTTEYLVDTNENAKGTKIVEERKNGRKVKTTELDFYGETKEVATFGPDGLATEVKKYDAIGKLWAVNMGIVPGGYAPLVDFLKQKGDIAIRERYDSGIYTLEATVLIEGEARKIQWEAPDSESDLKNVTNEVNGKTRVDLKKILELDPNAKGVPGSGLKFSRSGSDTMSDIISEGETDLSSDLNAILEQTKGVDRKKVFSAAKARQRGKNKGKFKFFVPPSADDFAGLMYAFMGKGKQGEKHHQFFKENLFDPFSKGMRHHKMVQQQVANDMKNLRKAMPDVRKKLGKKVPGTEYTHEDAIRIYNWSQAGLDIPGLSQADATALINAVESDPKLQAFAQGVNSISNTPGGMVDPGPHWTGGNIALDLKEALDNARGNSLQQWIENKNIIFSEANMNKIEAVYGSNFREALEDSLYRMETGSTQNVGKDRLLNNFTAWIHGSIGTTMFLNARSAMLQMISNVNFVNWSDNNMLKAAGAFANQKQYWKDVSMIFNSPFLKQRRSGIQTDVNAAELLAQIKDSKNKMKAAVAYLLQLGFTPTQIADSLAIATGGATFYRNRMKTYLKEGMTKLEAETKAFEDMMEIAEETQQSTRADKISQQQASPIGKFILAFQNTPMQYNRLIKKAAQDLVNGRGDPKANISRIVYYGGIQNLIFYGLQTALFAALFSDDEEDDITGKKTERVVNGMVDTLLRGSGIGGAVVSTVKNVIIKFMKESEKMDDGVYYTDPDWGNVVIEGLNISPPIGIKARKIYSGLKTWEYNKDVIDHMSKTDLDNPIYDAISSVIEAATNVPLSRAYSKYQNISEALNAEHEAWKRIAMLLGWNKWSFGIKNQDVVTAKSEVKEIKAEKSEQKKDMKKLAKEVERQAQEEMGEEDNLLEQQEERERGEKDIKCAAVSRSGKRCGKKILAGQNYCTIHESVEQRVDGKKTQCTHIKSDGKRCKVKTASKSGKCYYHD